MEDGPIDNQQLWKTLFKLYARNKSGFADEADTIAAMVSMGQEPEEAQRILARQCDDGRPSLPLFQRLLEECVTLNLAGVAVSASYWQRELVIHLLGALKDFERRALARGECMAAAQSRHRAKQIRAAEGLRQTHEMGVRQRVEKSGAAEAHVSEALEFTMAWSSNMQKFEVHTAKIVQELRDRQAAALVAFAETTHAEAKARFKPSKAMLDLVKTQERLARSGNYPEAQRCGRKVRVLLREGASSMQAAADEGAAKKVDVFRRRQSIEEEGLVTRIERGRAEHSAHWAQGAARLVQSHKNMATDLGLRQSLETYKAPVAIKTSMAPVISGRVASPRSRTPKPAYAGQLLAPAPKLRPSQLG